MAYSVVGPGLNPQLGHLSRTNLESILDLVGSFYKSNLWIHTLLSGKAGWLSAHHTYLSPMQLSVVANEFGSIPVLFKLYPGTPVSSYPKTAFSLVIKNFLSSLTQLVNLCTHPLLDPPAHQPPHQTHPTHLPTSTSTPHHMNLYTHPHQPTNHHTRSLTLMSLIRIWNGVSSCGLLSITSCIAYVHFHASSCELVYKLKEHRRP